MAQGQRNDLPPCPKCACGCGRRVRRRRHKFIDGHVPVTLRSQWGAKSSQIRRFAARRRIFAEEFARLTHEGRTLTKEAILDAFRSVADRYYLMGYTASEGKWKKRIGERRRVAA